MPSMLIGLCVGGRATAGRPADGSPTLDLDFTSTEPTLEVDFITMSFRAFEQDSTVDFAGSYRIWS